MHQQRAVLTRWTPGEPVTLETESYRLRSLGEDDASERYVGWLNDPEVNKFLEVRFQESTVESVKQYIRSHDNRTAFLLGIFDKASGLHIGNYSAICDMNHMRAMLGVMIGDREYWGKRVVLETRAAVLDFLFAEVGVAKVHGACYSNNLPAVYNYKAQGFQNEGILKSHAVSDGRRVDLVQFAMHRDVWMERRSRNE